MSIFSRETGFAVAFLAVVAVGLSVSGVFSGIGGDHEPRLGECPVTDEGDIMGTCENEYGQVESLDRGFSASDASFWLVIDDIEPTGDSHAPHTYWLYNQGLISEDVDEEHVNEFSNLHINHGDLQWNSSLKKGLEAGTQCRANIDVESFREIDYYYGDAENPDRKRYDDDDYGESDIYNIQELMPNPVQVEASDIRIKEDYMACKFDMAEILNKGAEHTPFRKWSGFNPVIAGDDADEGSTSLDIRFNLDMDKDGVLREQDLCPGTEEGVEVDRNGCKIEEDPDQDEEDSTQDDSSSEDDSEKNDGSEEKDSGFISGLIDSVLSFFGGLLP